MSEKPRKSKKEEVLDSSSEQEQVEVKKKKSSKETVDDADGDKKRKKKTPREEALVESAADSSSGRGHSKEQSVATIARLNATALHGVDDMEEMAQKSARTPRQAPTLAESPRGNGEDAEGGPNRAHLATAQNDAERKKIESVPRLYVNVTEAKGPKPGSYYVTVHFGSSKDIAWQSETTKKSTTFDNRGRLLPIPSGATHVTLNLYEKGLVSDTNKGEAVWDLQAISDGYPHQPWAPMLKKGETKSQLRVQLMYLPENVDLDGDEFVTPLHALIRKNKLELLTRAVDDIFADLTLGDAEGRTPLHLAVEYNKTKFVKILLKKAPAGEAARMLTPKKETALHFAGKFRSSGSIANALVGAGFDVNALADLKRTPLHYAAAAGAVEVIEVLAAAPGVQLNAQDKSDNTPLNDALTNDRTEAIAELLQYDTDLYLKNDKELAVWEIAQRKDLVATEARKAFMDTLNVHDPREFAYRPKFPKKQTVKGARCELDFEESTQFAISVAEKMEVVIVLTTDDLIATPAFSAQSCFALVKSDEGVHNALAISRDAVSLSGNRAVKVTLEPNFFYDVVPYAKAQEAVRDYTLVVMTPKKKSVTITPLRKWKHTAVVEDKWVAGKTAGGAQPSPTWVDNPKFEVTMPSEDDFPFAVLLTQEEDGSHPETRYVEGDDHKLLPYDFAVGFYVCDRQGVKVLDQVEKWSNARDVHQHFQMDFSQRNHLCIIPTMHKPGMEGPFTLRVYADEPITVEAK